MNELTRLTRLSEDLLAISRLNALDAAGHFNLVDLNRVVEEIVVTHRPLPLAQGEGVTQAEG